MIAIKEIEKKVSADDTIILLEQPHYLKLHGRTIEIKQVNWYYDWPHLAYWLGVFLEYYHAICKISQLPDRLSDIEEFRKNIRLVIGINKVAFSALKKICGYTYQYEEQKGKVKRVSNKKFWPLRWMKKMFTIDDWLEVFLYVYLYNIKGVKKNLYAALLHLGKAQLN